MNHLPSQFAQPILGAAEEPHEAAHGGAQGAAGGAREAAAAVAHGAHGAAAHGAHEIVRLIPHDSAWLFLIPLFPLVGFVINALAGAWIQRSMGKKANHTLAIGAMVLSWLVGLF